VKEAEVDTHQVAHLVAVERMLVHKDIQAAVVKVNGEK
jgi:hypothetical protein